MYFTMYFRGFGSCIFVQAYKKQASKLNTRNRKRQHHDEFQLASVGSKGGKRSCDKDKKAHFAIIGALEGIVINQHSNDDVFKFSWCMPFIPPIMRGG